MSQSNSEKVTSQSAEESPREKFERERLTRRAALAKIGIRAGATAFAMFSIDDFARMALAKMQEHQSMRQVADVVGKEFRSAGFAFASFTTAPPMDKSQCVSGASVYNYCRYHFHQTPAEADPLAK